MKTILFVCGQNAGRSQMAESFVMKLAHERNLPVRARSAGTIAGSTINPLVVQAMEEIGISMVGRRSKLLTQELVDMADIIITMGCQVPQDACPAGFLVTEDWGLEDPAGHPIEKVRQIRDHIRERVERLLAEIEADQKNLS